MHPLQRQRPFLQSVLRKKNDYLGQERSQHANASTIPTIASAALLSERGR